MIEMTSRFNSDEYNHLHSAECAVLNSIDAFGPMTLPEIMGVSGVCLRAGRECVRLLSIKRGMIEAGTTWRDGVEEVSWGLVPSLIEI